jgi:hypothetical protein
MIDLKPSYRGSLIAIAIVIAMAWCTTPAEADDLLSVDAAGLKEVVTTLCGKQAQALTKSESEEEFLTLYQECIQFVFGILNPVEMQHNHS